MYGTLGLLPSCKNDWHSLFFKAGMERMDPKNRMNPWIFSSGGDLGSTNLYKNYNQGQSIASVFVWQWTKGAFVPTLIGFFLVKKSHDVKKKSQKCGVI